MTPEVVSDAVRGMTKVWVLLVCSTVLPFELNVATVAGRFYEALVVT